LRLFLHDLPSGPEKERVPRGVRVTATNQSNREESFLHHLLPRSGALGPRRNASALGYDDCAIPLSKRLSKAHPDFVCPGTPPCKHPSSTRRLSPAPFSLDRFGVFMDPEPPSASSLTFSRPIARSTRLASLLFLNPDGGHLVFGGYLKFQEMVRCMAVCRRWANWIASSPLLWRELVIPDQVSLKHSQHRKQ
jgi:hypothetical protein